jgi:hypothetical protein
LFSAIPEIVFAAVFVSAGIFVILLFGLICFFLLLLKIKEEVKKRKELIAR